MRVGSCLVARRAHSSPRLAPQAQDTAIVSFGVLGLAVNPGAELEHEKLRTPVCVAGSRSPPSFFFKRGAASPQPACTSACRCWAAIDGSSFSCDRSLLAARSWLRRRACCRGFAFGGCGGRGGRGGRSRGSTRGQLLIRDSLIEFGDRFFGSSLVARVGSELFVGLASPRQIAQ